MHYLKMIYFYSNNNNWYKWLINYRMNRINNKILNLYYLLFFLNKIIIKNKIFLININNNNKFWWINYHQRIKILKCTKIFKIWTIKSLFKIKNCNYCKLNYLIVTLNLISFQLVLQVNQWFKAWITIYFNKLNNSLFLFQLLHNKRTLFIKINLCSNNKDINLQIIIKKDFNNNNSSYLTQCKRELSKFNNLNKINKTITWIF